MKYFLLALLSFAVIGCGHNEFDVSPAQVSRHAAAQKPAGSDQSGLQQAKADSKVKVKKGERLPDGSIADHDYTFDVTPDGK